MTFDLTGLAPGRPRPSPPCVHRFDLDASFDAAAMEAISIAPGPHLSSGGGMIPVLRCQAWLAAQLAALPQARAVCWHAARSCCSPGYFRDVVLRWIAGGAFPGLGLTGLAMQPDGAMQSEGLALFTGQELRLGPDLASDPEHGAKLALRLLHWLVEHGPLEDAISLTGPSGESLLIEPSHKQGIVDVWKGSR